MKIEWVKISVDMFDNRKIRQLRTLPDGDSVVLLWISLICLAGKCNAKGLIFLTENIPYTPKMLADELNFEENTVNMALDALERFGMIQRDGFISITDWENHQNVEGMEKIRENNRLRKQKQRELARLTSGNSDVSRDGHVTVTQQNKSKIENKSYIYNNTYTGNYSSNSNPTFFNSTSNEVESLYCETQNNEESEIEEQIQQVIEAWNALGIGKVRKIPKDTGRHIMLSKRLKDYGLPSVLEAVANVGKSSFLMGKNKKGKPFPFDWVIKPNNFPKVLDGNYNDKTQADVGETAKKAAAWLAQTISENVPDMVPPSEEELLQWAADLTELHDSGYKWKLISDVAVWSMDDDFWRSKILSGGDLKRNFKKLLAKKADDERKRAT